MDRTKWLAAVVTLCTVTAMSAAWAETHSQRRKHGRSMSISDGNVVNDCSDLRVTFGHGKYAQEEVARREQSAKLAVTAGSPLAAEASRNGGVYVVGTQAKEFAVRACLFATGDSRAEAEALLAKLVLSANGARATITGPGEDDWVGFLIIQAPRSSAVDVRSWNGPVSVREVAGRVHVTSENGPVSLHDTSGEVEVDSENGPIHIAGTEGRFRVRAQNGPLHVELSGTRWQSGSLDASTQNGPIHLEVPDGYESGVLVDVSEHSPVECHAAQCRKAVRTWERPTRIEFGSSAVVRLSTENGPVTVSGTR